MKRNFQVAHWLALISLVHLLAGCGSLSPQAQGAETVDGGAQAVAVARGMIGVPYRYGGATPRGFDCSGLVHYSYAQVGRQVPRATHAQYARSKPVHMSRITPGDLLFFTIDNKVSHVGIYVGDDRFVHAPSSGKPVGYGSLDNPYWSKRLVKVGRF